MVSTAEDGQLSMFDSDTLYVGELFSQPVREKHQTSCANDSINVTVPGVGLQKTNSERYHHKRIVVRRKYYMTYISSPKQSSSQVNMQTVSPTLSEVSDSHTYSTRESFDLWRCCMRKKLDGKLIVDRLVEATRAIAKEEEVIDVLTSEVKESNTEVRNIFTQLLRGQLQTKQQIVELLKYQREATDSLLEKLPSMYAHHIVTNIAPSLAELISSCVSSSVKKAITECIPQIHTLVHTTSSAPDLLHLKQKIQYTGSSYKGQTGPTVPLVATCTKSISETNKAESVDPGHTSMICDELRNASKRKKIESSDVTNNPQRKNIHIGGKDKAKAGQHLPFVIQRNSQTLCKVSDSITETNIQETNYIQRRTVSRENRHKRVNTSCNNTKVTVSPVNALDDTLYFQAGVGSSSSPTESVASSSVKDLPQTRAILDRFNRSSEAARRRERIFAEISGSNNVHQLQEISMSLKHQQNVTSVEESP